MSSSNELRGRIAELKAMATCAARGWEVALPMHLINCVYDIAIRRTLEEGWMKIQIKRAFLNHKTGAYRVDLRDGGKKKYTVNSINAFMIWIAETDTWYFIPHGELKSTSGLNLFNKYDKYILPPEPIE